jgi:bifunctional DNA-binding transcriptional regulator/antitoxin component of YhaV-PrlF toxin-antitoxin module
MGAFEISRIGRRGHFVLPANLRERYGLGEGSLIIAEAREDGILIRAAGELPPEQYTDQRKAELLLNNAIDAEDYAQACQEVRRMGLDPAAIPHRAPEGA